MTSFQAMTLFLIVAATASQAVVIPTDNPLHQPTSVSKSYSSTDSPQHHTNVRRGQDSDSEIEIENGFMFLKSEEDFEMVYEPDVSFMSESQRLEAGAAPRPPTVPIGLYPDTSTCEDAWLQIVEAAIDDILTLSRAGRHALSPDLVDFTGNPARYFFGPDADVTVASLLLDAGLHGGPPNTRANLKYPIRVVCDEKFDNCNGSPDVFGYVPTNAPDTIVLCEAFFHLPRLEQPCTGGLSNDAMRGVGTTNTAHALLHLFLHAFSEGKVKDYASGTRESHALLLKNDAYRRPEENADSIAWFALWAHDLGFGDKDSTGARCLELFPPPPTNWAAGEWPYYHWMYSWRPRTKPGAPVDSMLREGR